MKTLKLLLLSLGLVISLTSCFQIKTHHTIDPITINMNVAVKVDRELDNMFADLDEQSSTIETD